MNRSIDIEVKVGIFVAIGTLLLALALILAGGEKAFFERRMTYKVSYPQVDGLQVGATVKVAGYRVGEVTDMFFKDSGEIEVTLQVIKKYAHFIREDSLAQVGTQGVLGDKYINITVGSNKVAQISDGGTLTPEQSKEIKDYLSKGDQLIENMNSSLQHLDGILKSFHRDGRAEKFFRNMSVAAQNITESSQDMPKATKELQATIAHFNSIMAKVDRGDGTLGALINDSTLYDDMKGLLGGANRNRVLKYFIKKSVEDTREAREANREAAGKQD